MWLQPLHFIITNLHRNRLILFSGFWRQLLTFQNPGEIKRREVSWIIVKGASPDEAKSREAVLG